MRPDTYPRLAARLGLSMLLLLGLASCRAPFLSPQDGVGLTLDFLVSGQARLDAPTAYAPRLLLPSATRLQVTLSTDRAGVSTPPAAEVPVDTSQGSGTATVSFSDVQLGAWTVRAEALDAGGSVLYRQVATIQVTSDATPITLNLVPASPAEVPLLSDQSLTVSLAAGVSRAWRVPADSALLRGYRGYLTPADATLLYFVQSLEGELLASGASTTPINAAALPSGADFYLTFYNAGASSRSFLYSLTQAGAAGVETIWVPAGSYQRDGTATNVSTVSPFYLGKREITRAQWGAVTGMVTDPESEHWPMTDMTWFDAAGFCNKLSIAENLEPAYTITDSGTPWGGSFPVTTTSTVTLDPSKNGYRLPTEAEWMWAAMGATKGKGYSGGTFATGYQKAYAGDDPSTNADDGAISDYAWYSENSADALHDIGGKLPNELGLYDMTGNALEWCQDYHSAYPPGTIVNYPGPVSGIAMVFRGGAYNAAAGNCTVADRDISTAPSNPQSNPGFRVARNGQPLYRVIYDLNGGSGSLPVDANRYDSAMSATVAGTIGIYRYGYELVGWNTRSDGNGAYLTSGGTVPLTSGSVRAYIVWNALPTFDGEAYATSSPAWTPIADYNDGSGNRPTVLRSGAIGPSASSVIEMTYYDGYGYLKSLSFSYKLASKADVGFLKLEVFFNGVLQTLPTQSSWTGAIPWAESFNTWSTFYQLPITYPMKIRWTYYKNDGENSEAGEDAAWIDDVNISTGSY